MADGSLFRVQVVTPERVLLAGLASDVTLRTGEGDTTFLAGHAPLVGTILPGVIRVVQDEGDEVLVAGHGGFVQVEQLVGSDDPADATASAGSATDGDAGTRVTLLVGVAELAVEIDIERARAALETAQARVSELGGAAARADEEGQPSTELAAAEAALRRAEVRLEAADALTSSPGPGVGATAV